MKRFKTIILFLTPRIIYAIVLMLYAPYTSGDRSQKKHRFLRGLVDPRTGSIRIQISLFVNSIHSSVDRNIHTVASISASQCILEPSDVKIEP